MLMNSRTEDLWILNEFQMWISDYSSTYTKECEKLEMISEIVGGGIAEIFTWESVSTNNSAFFG